MSHPTKSARREGSLGRARDPGRGQPGGGLGGAHRRGPARGVARPGSRARSDRGRRDRRPRRRRTSAPAPSRPSRRTSDSPSPGHARRGRELRRVHDRGAARRQPGDRRRDARSARTAPMAAGGWGPRLARLQRVTATSYSSLEGTGAPTGRLGLRRARRPDAPASGRDPRPRRHRDRERPRRAAADHPAGRRQAPLRPARRRPRQLDAGRPGDALQAAAAAARRGGPLDPDGERRVGRPPRRPAALAREAARPVSSSIGTWPKRPSRRRNTSRSCSGSRRPGCRSTAPTSPVPCSSRRPPSTR